MIVSDYLTLLKASGSVSMEVRRIRYLGVESYKILTLYFIIPRTGSSTQLTENRTTLELSFLISPGVSTNSIVKVFIKQRRY